MSDSKRKLSETENTVNKQIKLELGDDDECNLNNVKQESKQEDPAVIQLLKLKSVLEKVINSEISLAKEDLDTIEDRIFQTRLCLIKVRQGIVSDFYRQPSKEKLQRPLHPAVQKLSGGKKPVRRTGKKSPHFESDSGSSDKGSNSGTNCDYFYSEPGPSGLSLSDSLNVVKIEKSEDEEDIDIMDVEIKEETKDQEYTNSTSENESLIKSEPPENDTDSSQVSDKGKLTKVPRYIPPKTSSLPVCKFNEPRGNISKQKVRIIIGNVSKWLGSDGLNATHKWTVYIKNQDGTDLNKIISKVKYFLHPSYKPNDIVQISNAPFKLCKRGWGEFPLRVQFHFINPNDKPVDVVHNLKLDRTYTGMETFGCETVIDIWLSHVDSNENKHSTADNSSDAKNKNLPCNLKADLDSSSKEKSSESGELEWINPIDSFIDEFDFNYLNRNPEDALKSFTDEITNFDKENKTRAESKDCNELSAGRKCENSNSNETSDSILMPADSRKAEKQMETFDFCSNENVDPNNGFPNPFSNPLIPPFSVQEQNHDWNISQTNEVLSKEVCDKIESSLSSEDISSLSLEALKNNPLLRDEVGEIKRKNDLADDPKTQSLDTSAELEGPVEDEAEEVLSDYQVEVVLDGEDVDSSQSVEYCETEITIDENCDNSVSSINNNSFTPNDGSIPAASEPNSASSDTMKENNGDKNINVKDVMIVPKSAVNNIKLVNFNQESIIPLSTKNVPLNYFLNKTGASTDSQSGSPNLIRPNEKVLILPKNNLLVKKTNVGFVPDKLIEVPRNQGVFKVNYLKIQKEDQTSGIVRTVGHIPNQVIVNAAKPGVSLLKVSEGVNQLNQALKRKDIRKICPVQKMKSNKLKASTGVASLVPAPHLKPASRKKSDFAASKPQNCVKLVSLPNKNMSVKQIVLSSKNPLNLSSLPMNHQGKVVIVKKQDLMSSSNSLNSNAQCLLNSSKSVKSDSNNSLQQTPQNDYGSCPRDSVESAVRWLLEYHPLVDPLATSMQFRTVHPYCAESDEHFLSWPIAKQRAAEWLRAKTIARLLPKICPHLKPWRMMDVIRFARFRAYTPLPMYKGPLRVDDNVKVSLNYSVFNPEDLVKNSYAKSSLEEVDVVKLDSPNASKRLTGTDDTSSDDEYDESGEMVTWISSFCRNVNVGTSLALLSAFRSLCDDILRRSFEQSWFRHNYRKPPIVEKVDVIKSLSSREEFDLFTNDGLGKLKVPQNDQSENSKTSTSCSKSNDKK